MKENINEKTNICTRRFNFPRELVYKAFWTPDQLALWWGPKGFTNTFHEFDFRPGGTWQFVMHGPDGTDYTNHSVFEDILPLERIVIHHLNAPEFHLSITFEEIEGQTQVTFSQLFEKPIESVHSKKFLSEANEQIFDRLNEVIKIQMTF